jgi:hypothetical protein
MARLQAKSIAGVVGIAFATAISFMPAPAEAAKMTKAEKAAWTQANVACKGQAKGKKLGWLARRKFVKGCLTEALKGYPNIDIESLMRDVRGRTLPATRVESHI